MSENILEVKIKGYQCLKCEKCYSNVIQAESCCKQYFCETCGVKTPKYYLSCQKCTDKRRFNDYPKVNESEYDFEWLSWGGEFYSSAEDLIESCKADEIEVPTWVFGCEKLEFSIDGYSVLENACEEQHEDFFSTLDDVKEFTDFVDKWVKKQTSYSVCETKLIVLMGK